MNHVVLFVVSDEWTRFHKPFGYGPDEMYEYFLTEPDAPTRDECAPPPSPLPQLKSGWTRGWGERERADRFFFQNMSGDVAFSELATIQSFRGLAEALQSRRGPRRVVWVGQRFGWVHPRYASSKYEQTGVTGGSYPVEPMRSWSYGFGLTPAYLWLDAFTRAGISFWPIVWLDGESEQAEGPRTALKEASEIAQYLGGQADFCNEDLTACLKNPVDVSSHGWIVRIAGPKVDWPNGWSARCLHLWYQPDPSVLDIKRPFVRLAKPHPKPSTKTLMWRTVKPSVPLFDSVSLSGVAGCDAGAAGGVKKNAMTALVPDAAVRGLQAYVEVLSVGPGTPEKQLSKRQERAFVLGNDVQLHTRPLPQLLRETGQGTAEICVDLPAKRQTHGSYRIVLFKPKAGWAGVGILPVADVVEYLQQH